MKRAHHLVSGRRVGLPWKQQDQLQDRLIPGLPKERCTFCDAYNLQLELVGIDL